jgi:hypothetical protein
MTDCVHLLHVERDPSSVDGWRYTSICHLDVAANDPKSFSENLWSVTCSHCRLWISGRGLRNPTTTDTKVSASEAARA